MTGIAGGSSLDWHTDFAYYTRYHDHRHFARLQPDRRRRVYRDRELAGDSNYAGSTSNSTTFTVTKAGTSLTLSSPPGGIVYDGTTVVTS